MPNIVFDILMVLSWGIVDKQLIKIREYHHFYLWAITIFHINVINIFIIILMFL